MAARDAHMALLEKHKAAGIVHYGAAILNESEKMIGSMMVVEYPDRAALNAWLVEEPYIIGKVWDKVAVQPCKVAPPFIKK